MSVTLVMVQSLDGKTTHEFSQEDREHFEKLRDSFNVIVMGRKTYEAAKPTVSSSTLRVVLTKHPEKYKNIPGQIQFISESPERIVAQYKSMLLVGGSEINKLFFEKKLITECYITIEPKIFGNGSGLVAPANLNISLELLDQKLLNKQGTLVLHYKVHYDH